MLNLSKDFPFIFSWGSKYTYEDSFGSVHSLLCSAEDWIGFCMAA